MTSEDQEGFYQFKLHLSDTRQPDGVYNEQIFDIQTIIIFGTHVPEEEEIAQSMPGMSEESFE